MGLKWKNKGEGINSWWAHYDFAWCEFGEESLWNSIDSSFFNIDFIFEIQFKVCGNQFN